ncbi:MAG TPA: hypothetical protein DEQ38_09355 [Elusimicrobia bacterium]|nr:MAG: hypothetical protein A2089_13660 [Elusimicrobia bacterium GWD2_63_28]HCC48301.1 hypothetical protein [Elusimicrobiota bacterium]
MPKLQDLKTGDWVRWDSQQWEVTDRDLYKESADYQEVQWELESSAGTRYLVMSRENKGGSVEEVWVCTRQASIGDVERQLPSGEWESFGETDSVPAAPARVRFCGLGFKLDGETEGIAEDDDGNNVTKLTWDYYDDTRKRNLAIEIWKEPDADYYEAYDGDVVKSSDFSVIPPSAAPRRSLLRGSEAAGTFVAGCFVCFFFLPIVAGVMGAFDTGAEYLVALLVPAACAFIAVLAGAHRGLLAVALAAAVGGAILALKLRGLGGSYWEYAMYGALGGAAIAEFFSRVFSVERSSEKGWIAANASLLFLYIVGFAHYIKFAPRPHNPGGLLAACALPLLPAAAVFLVYFFKGGSDEPA